MKIQGQVNNLEARLEGVEGSFRNFTVTCQQQIQHLAMQNQSISSSQRRRDSMENFSEARNNHIQSLAQDSDFDDSPLGMINAGQQNGTDGGDELDEDGIENGLTEDEDEADNENDEEDDENEDDTDGGQIDQRLLVTETEEESVNELTKGIKYLNEGKINQAYSFVLSRDDDDLLLSVMQHSGIIIEQLDNHNVEYLISKFEDFLKTGSYVDEILPWMARCAQTGLKLSLSVHNALISSLQRFVDEGKAGTQAQIDGCRQLIQIMKSGGNVYKSSETLSTGGSESYDI